MRCGLKSSLRRYWKSLYSVTACVCGVDWNPIKFWWIFCTKCHRLRMRCGLKCQNHLWDVQRLFVTACVCGVDWNPKYDNSKLYSYVTACVCGVDWNQSLEEATIKVNCHRLRMRCGLKWFYHIAKSTEENVTACVCGADWNNHVDQSQIGVLKSPLAYAVWIEKNKITS